MAEALRNSIAVVGIDIGKNSFHVVGLNGRGAIVLPQPPEAWPRGPVDAGAVCSALFERTEERLP
jgi:transposase